MMIEGITTFLALYSIVTFITGIWVLGAVEVDEPDYSDLLTASIIGLTWPLFWSWRLAYK